MPGVMPAVFNAFNRVNGLNAPKGLKVSAGQAALTASNSAEIDTGLKNVTHVICTTVGATAGYATCVSKTGGKIILKANASLTFDWVAFGT